MMAEAGEHSVFRYDVLSFQRTCQKMRTRWGESRARYLTTYGLLFFTFQEK